MHVVDCITVDQSGSSYGSDEENCEILHLEAGNLRNWEWKRITCTVHATPRTKCDLFGKDLLVVAVGAILVCVLYFVCHNLPYTFLILMKSF